MDVGRDRDGRKITFDEASGAFSIAGIATSIDRIIAYDRGNQIIWASDEVREWAHEWEQGRKSQAAAYEQARAQEAAANESTRERAAARTQLKVQGYDPGPIVQLSGTLRGLATAFIIVSTVVGVLVGLTIGALASGPYPAAMLLFGLLFGGFSCFGAYLGSLVLKVAANVQLTAVQIEMNTRPE